MNGCIRMSRISCLRVRIAPVKNRKRIILSKVAITIAVIIVVSLKEVLEINKYFQM